MGERKVTSTEFQSRVGFYLDEAARGPVVVTQHGRPSRVLIDFHEYERLKQCGMPQAIGPGDFTDEELAALEAAEMDPRHNHLNALLDWR